MEELMKTKIFKVTVERLLLNGGQTLYMVGWSLLIGTIIGMILALILVLCRKGGLVENRPLYMIVSVYINVVRSIPFVILLVTIMPITRAIVGTTIGSTAALVPLVVYISPYLARLMENSLLEIDPGILEAAEAMGATTWQVIRYFLVPNMDNFSWMTVVAAMGQMFYSLSIAMGILVTWSFWYRYCRFLEIRFPES